MASLTFKDNVSEILIKSKTTICIQENEIENLVGKIVPRAQCFNPIHFYSGSMLLYDCCWIYSWQAVDWSIDPLAGSFIVASA